MPMLTITAINGIEAKNRSVGFHDDGLGSLYANSTVNTSITKKPTSASRKESHKVEVYLLRFDARP